MPQIAIPALTVHLSTAVNSKMMLPTGSVCCVAAFPSTSKQITFVPMDTAGAYHLPQSVVELETNPISKATKLNPAIMFRFAAPGMSLSEPTGIVMSEKEKLGVHQHVVTEYVGMRNMLQTVGQGACHEQETMVLEDQLALKATFTLAENTVKSRALCMKSLSDLQAHCEKLEMAHGTSLLSVPQLVETVMRGKETRQQSVRTTTQMLFGIKEMGAVDWNLKASRAAPGLQIDMQVADQIRLGSMQANMGAYMQTLALNLGGMLAQITQRFNGDLGNNMSTQNALELWGKTSDRNQIIGEFRNAVEKTTVCMNTYLADPQWVCNNGRIEIDKNNAGEDQEICGGTAVENMITAQQMGSTQIFADCEDTGAQNAAQMSLMQLPRTELHTGLADALSKIPTHFATSDAKSDYTLLSSHILSLGMKIYDAFQTPTSCVPTIKTQGEMLSCLKEKLNDSSDTQMHVSTAALVASAPKLECDTLITKTSANNINDIQSYTQNWKNKLNDSKHGAGWMGHSTCAHLETIPLCEHDGVVMHVVKDMRILEGTNCAFQLKGSNGLVSMNLLASRKNDLRETVQTQLDKTNKPLSTVMAINLGGTVLASELRVALHSEGHMHNVNATQVYKLNSHNTENCVDGAFYRCLVTAGKMECATLDLKTLQSYTGIALDVAKFPNTVNVALEAKMSPQEIEACTLLGNVFSLGRLSAGQQAKTQAILSPLQTRMVLVPKCSPALGVEARTMLQAQTAVEAHVQSNMMGCVLKSADLTHVTKEQMQARAEDTAAIASKVYGTEATMSFGPFTTSMILTVPV